MKLAYIMIILFSTQLHANDAAKIKNLMNNYLKAMNQKNEPLIKDISTKKYYNLLKKNKTLTDFFNKNKSQNKKDFKFDMIYKKAAIDKNLYLVNIKDIKKKEYGDYWYLVLVKDGKYLIDDMQFFD